MSESGLTCTRGRPGVATLWLDRPEVHNAFDDRLIAALADALDELAACSDTRVVILAAAGSTFSAGADLAWMRRMAGADHGQNRADALALARMLQRLDELPQVTIARVQGAAYGGAVGLISCCDLAVAVPAARFCLAEVRLGLVPATIGPYLRAAIGARACRRYFATAEVFDAQRAQQLGLVSELASPEQLDARIAGFIDELLLAGPRALVEAKRLVAGLAAQPPGEELGEATSELIARLRVSPEGQEGLQAFLERRPPRWRG